MKRRILAADVLVLNHTLFFMHLGGLEEEAREGVLFKNDFVIFDEAHTVEHVASQHIGLSISQSQVRYSLNRLWNPKTNNGMLNLLGSLWIGVAIRERRMKLALAWIYFARALLIIAFYFAPKTPLAFFIFSAGIGFTYLSTVPPTVGLVAKLHGARYLATLFGIVMLSHQVGGFLGAWLGGKAFEATGSYDWMWWADAALCLFAAAVHLPIREARPAPAAAAA